MLSTIAKTGCLTSPLDLSTVNQLVKTLCSNKAPSEFDTVIALLTHGYCSKYLRFESIVE